MTQHLSSAQNSLPLADEFLWLDVERELELICCGETEEQQSHYTAEDMEQIRLAYILAGPYESPYAESGASKRQQRRKRKGYANGGAARNRLYDLQNGFGGIVPEYFQQEKLENWSADAIQGMEAGQLRGYMALWLRPLLVSGNASAVKTILSAYRTALEAEKTAATELLESLVPELSITAEQITELDEFVASLAETRKNDELGLRKTETPLRHPPVSPIAPPRA